MEENNNNKQQPQVIDLRLVAKKIWDNRRLFYKVLPITFVLSCIYILGVPRSYTSEIILAPEMENSGMGGAIGSLAASFGFDMSDMQTSDAITPLLYPDLMEDNGFVTSFFNIKVQSADGEIDTTYYHYLDKEQKENIWMTPFYWLKRNLKFEASTPESDSGKFDPYRLSKHDHEIAEIIRGALRSVLTRKQERSPLTQRLRTHSSARHLQTPYADNYKSSLPTIVPTRRVQTTSITRS